MSEKVCKTHVLFLAISFGLGRILRRVAPLSCPRHSHNIFYLTTDQSNKQTASLTGKRRSRHRLHYQRRRLHFRHHCYRRCLHCYCCCSPRAPQHSHCLQGAVAEAELHYSPQQASLRMAEAVAGHQMQVAAQRPQATMMQQWPDSYLLRLPASRFQTSSWRRTPRSSRTRRRLQRRDAARSRAT